MGSIFKCVYSGNTPQWAEGWSLIQEVIVPNHDVTFFFFFCTVNTPTKRKSRHKISCCPNFSCRGLQSQNFGEKLAVFGCGKVNFGNQYFRICSVFVQHIYTRLKGFLVTFSMMYITI